MERCACAPGISSTTQSLEVTYWPEGKATPQDWTIPYAGRGRATNRQATDAGAGADPDQRSVAAQDPKLLDDFADTEANTKV